MCHGSYSRMSYNMSRSIRISSSAIIGNLSYISSVWVGVIVNMLSASVRKVDTVRTFSISSSVTGLGSIEVRGGVIVSYGVVVCVGGDLVRVDLSSVGNNRGVVARGSVSYNRGSMSHSRGVVCRGSMGHYRGVVSRGGVSHNRGNSMANSMSSNTMTNNSMSSDDTMMTTVCSMESVGRISYSSHGGSEGLGLGGGSVLSLVRLGDRLVRDLTSTNSYMSNNTMSPNNTVSSNNAMSCNKTMSPNNPVSSN